MKTAKDGLFYKTVMNACSTTVCQCMPKRQSTHLHITGAWERLSSLHCI